MKKILLALPVILLVATGCNSSQPTTEQTPPAQQTQTTQTQQQVSQNPTPTPIADPTAGWNVYTDTQYGFQIKLPPHYQFDGELVQNTSGQFVRTSENQKFNNSIVSPTANPPSMQVSLFNKLPKTGQTVCDTGDKRYDENGNLLACNPQNQFAQDNLLNLAKIISGAKINQSVTLPAYLASGATTGTVVDLNGSKGLLIVARNTQAVGSTVSLYWFDKSSNFIDIYQELDPSSVAEAVQTQQYKTFLTIVSTFKLIK